MFFSFKACLFLKSKTIVFGCVCSCNALAYTKPSHNYVVTTSYDEKRTHVVTIGVIINE